VEKKKNLHTIAQEDSTTLHQDRSQHGQIDIPISIESAVTNAPPPQLKAGPVIKPPHPSPRKSTTVLLKSCETAKSLCPSLLNRLLAIEYGQLPQLKVVGLVKRPL